MSIFRRRNADAIWQGVYRSFAEVPSAGAGFAGDVWAEHLSRQHEAARSGAWNDEFVHEHEALLLLICLIGRPLHIVDYGGGYGASYHYVRAMLPNVLMRYDVVEVPAVVAAAPRSGDELRFSTSFDDGVPDIVFVKSALQYVEDYRGTLASLFGLASRFVLLEKFSGVTSASYVSAQRNVEGSVFPYWFLSIDEITGIAKDARYDCVLHRRLARMYDQSEFPVELRMGQASTLLFARKSS